MSEDLIICPCGTAYEVVSCSTCCPTCELREEMEAQIEKLKADVDEALRGVQEWKRSRPIGQPSGSPYDARAPQRRGVRR